MSTVGSAVRETGASMRTVFRNRNLRRVNLALAGSMIGDWAYATAIAVWAYGIGGATAVGVWATVRLASLALVTPFMSALADRFSRKMLMISCDLVRAVLVLTVAGLVEADVPAAAIFVLATLSSLVGSPFRPAQLALLPSLVDQPDELVAANGVSSTLESLSFFVGPAIAGFLLAVADVGTVFAVNGLTFLWSAALVWGVRATARPSAEDASPAEESPAGEALPEPGFLSQSLAGFGVIWRNPHLRLVTLLYCAQTVVAGASVVFGVAVAIDIIDVGPAGVGYLDSVLGVGALLGGFIAIALAPRGRLATDFGLGVMLWALPLLVISAWPTRAAAFTAMALIGIANPIVDVNASTILQRITPDAYMGRVFGALETGLISTMALGSLLMPLLIAGPGLRWGLVAISVPIGALALLALPRLRVLDGVVGEPPLVALLRRVSLFQPLQRPLLESLSQQLVAMPVTAGTVVIREGELGDRFYVIESGHLDAQQGGRALRTMGPGDCFGEIALLRDVPRTATVVATEDCLLQVLDRGQFLAAMTGDTELRSRTETLASVRLATV